MRYAGEWVAAVVADTRALAEDAAELVEVEYEPLPHVIDPEQAMADASALVHPAHGSNVILHRNFVWGPVEDEFAKAEHQLALPRDLEPQRDGADRDVRASPRNGIPAPEILDIWASIQMPKYPDQAARALRLPGNAVRVHYDVDVGGSYGVKRGIKHTVLVGYLAKRLGMPVRLIEDRLENMRGGDMHGPDRIFDMTVAFDGDGTIRALKIRAIDDVGAYAGPRAVPARQAGQRDLRALSHRRGRLRADLGDDQQDAAGSGARLRPGADQLRARTHHGPRGAPPEHGSDRAAPEEPDPQGRVPVHDPERLDLRLRRLPHRARQGAGRDRLPGAALRRATRRGSAGKLAGIGISTCLEPSGGNSAFEPLLNPKNETTTWMDSCLVRVDLSGAITGIMGTSSSGQGHETLVSTVIGEVLERDPAQIRVIHADSLQALPSNSPVGSRMAIMLGGAAAGAARKIKETLIAIAAHNFECAKEDLDYRDGNVSAEGRAGKRLSWDQLVEIAHRKFHPMPPGIEPGLQAKFVWEVPTGGGLPTADGRIQIYPCYAFECHIVYVEIDPDTAAPAIKQYVCGHDCGVMINPDIVHGMTYGGIAHGIGAALYEKFTYDDNGQLTAGTFMDYLIPSALEVPPIKIVDHCTPSPLTTFGQKGSGEAGYLGAPAAVANAVNDALAPLDVEVNTLPISHLAIWETLMKAKR